MRLLYIADGRSPIALNWIQHFIEAGHEVHLLSTFPCEQLAGLNSIAIVPVAFSNLARRPAGAQRAATEQEASSESNLRAALTGARTIRLRTALRHWFGPLTLRRATDQARRLISNTKPDLVHAMRIPFEGALAAASDPECPLLVSVWGNDFTLHGPASPLMRRLTHRTVARADGLHTDCQRDRRLALSWSLREGTPVVVLPGNGGVRAEIFGPGGPRVPSNPELVRILSRIPPESPVVVNPRGFRGYVRNDTFFRSIPKVLEAIPKAAFLCPGMNGVRKAERWKAELGIGDSVHLLPKLSPADMAVVFRRSQVTVSVTEHDGTPNTLLEAMACGAYPVSGDLESIREWIEDGRTGSLVDPADPTALAHSVIQALQDEPLRTSSGRRNASLVAERADFAAGMLRAEAAYRELVG
ncbi:MAG: glycosyltransferase family 4 protein [Anaerolineales bacterium]